ncbi:MAG: DNA/RNA nuclease SfsA [Deltaproteobacteria bacterium]|nr:DNA/RNA nuclease SfsA [Deltaproteobacteria bacterium]
MTAAVSLPFAPPLVPGVLSRRYKRFLADVRLDDGREVTAHCMNTGAMTGCQEPGSRVWLTPHDDPRRKLQWTWRLASDGDVLVGVDTQLPNALVTAAVSANAVPELTGYTSLRREVRYGERSRIDLLADGHPDDRRPCYVEVKNVTLVSGGTALFPDAVTARGLTHLRELGAMVRAGHRAVMVYVVQRGDAERFAPAEAIDPAYAAGLREAVAGGVEAVALRCRVRPTDVALDRALPVGLGAGA